MELLMVCFHQIHNSSFNHLKQIRLLLKNSQGLEANDFFGLKLASEDFDCDGIADLAVGIPEEDVTFSGNGSELVVGIPG